MKNICPFCDISNHGVSERIIKQNDLAFVMHDGFPINLGHTLIIPKRHIASFFEITDDEREALFDLLYQTKVDLDKQHHPNAYNIGINDGMTAGQTIPHLHIHLIPRYEGDVDDPRGGIRQIMPEKADYWSNNK